ncbi:MAG: phosphatidylglycerol---prolipoprotein diacylglyceryl transferase [Candidatus Woesearchaeota archaeon]|nr:phosphatidylglycerol---prolipoprotein diacylglyceryl transferase [Candidatus Woesearchaeota archaeon]
MIYFTPHPVLFQIGPLEIRFYSLMYILGFLLAYYLIPKIQKYKSLNLSKDEILEMILLIFIFVIIFARAFYVFYYAFDIFIKDPAFLFKIWYGGMSFHGGLLGAIIAGIIISKRKKIPFFKLADVFIVPIPLALAFGRIGNLMNGELYGRVTNVPWAFFFPTAPDRGLLPRHPSQIYESIKNLVIFFILLYLLKSKNKRIAKLKEKDGFIFWTFVFLYGLLRYIIEFFRQPEIVFSIFNFQITAGQLLCLLMIIISLIGFYNLKE